MTKENKIIDDEIYVRKNLLRKKINVYCLYVGKQFEIIGYFVFLSIYYN